MVEYKETKSKEINKATYDLQHLNITGNVIPHNWFNTLRMENGAPDYQSIVLLSEIVYWYKPKDIFNEQGIQVGIGKKYDADTLQKSYEDLAEKFGMTKRQVREAVIRLENRGLVKRNFEYIKHKGMPLSNVLFIELFVDKLKEITIVLESVVPSSTESVIGVCSNSSEGYPRNRQTYTKSTTKSTTKIKDIKDNVTSVPLPVSKEDDKYPYKEVIDYLNKSANKGFKYVASHKKHIVARFKEGFTLEEFKKVIEVKTHQWLNDPKNNIYLRPETLFGNKMDGYLQEYYKPNNGQKKYQQPTPQVTSKEVIKSQPDHNGFDGTNLNEDMLLKGIDKDTLLTYYNIQLNVTGKQFVYDRKPMTYQEFKNFIEFI